MQIGCGISPTWTYGVAVPAFTPASISGLQLWLDASDASTLFTDSAGTTAATADGDPVGCWKDKSGNARNATQSDGLKKTALKSKIQNNLNSIRFDNSDEMYFSYITQSLPCYVYIVVREQNTTNSYKNLLGRTSDSAPGLYIGTSSLDREPAVYWNGDIRYGSSLTQATHLIRYRLSSGSLGFIVDGGAEVSLSHSQTVLTYWKGVSASVHPLNADLCELLLWNASISNSNNTSITNYLNNKWGVF